MRSNSTLMTAAILLMAGLVSSSESGRRLLAEEKMTAEKPDEEKAAGSLVFPGSSLPYVYDGHTADVYEELVPLVESMQTNEPLMEQVQVCADTIGITFVASEFAHVFFDAAAAFMAYGFCLLPNLEEHAERMSYMMDYAQSNTLKSVLLQDYLCEGMAAMPEECFLHDFIESALNESLALYDGKDGFCSGDTDKDHHKPQRIHVATVPLDYAPEYPVQYKCAPRPPQPITPTTTAVGATPWAQPVDPTAPVVTASPAAVAPTP